MSKDLFVILFLVIVIVFVPLVSVYQNLNTLAMEELSSISSTVTESIPTNLPIVSNSSSKIEILSTISEPSSKITTINTDSEFVFKRNFFKVWDKSTNKLLRLTPDEYVLGAIASEMPSTFHMEALVSQGIASLSYAVFRALQNDKNPNPNGADFDVDVKNHQGYADFNTIKAFYGENYIYNLEKLRDAAEIAKNYVLTYNNEPIAAAYHAISSGNTENSENVWGNPLPYLISVQSSCDILAHDYKTVVTYSPDELKTRLSSVNPTFLNDTDTWLEVISRSNAGYVTEIRVGNKVISGLDFRTLLNLRSSSFSISRQGNNFVFTVCGYGHGVGMSQNGADYMARQGLTYEEILKHYYKGAKLTKLTTKESY